MNKFKKLKAKLITLTASCLILTCPVHADEINLINVNGLPVYVVEQLKLIARDANEPNISLSSKQRSVKKQVEVMLDYYITCAAINDVKKKSTCGIELAKKVYNKECHAGFESYDKNASREKNILTMTQSLTLSLIKLGSQRRCMNHVIIPNIKTKFIAVDIRPSSVVNHAKFYDAVVANTMVVQFYYPDIPNKPKSLVRDGAFHIVFLRE